MKESIWKNTSQLPKFPKLEEDIKTDVLIIGGGIAGILTAYFLHQRGVDYTLIEKDRICSGVTENTTAKITLQHSLIYSKILKSRGIDMARGYYLANLKAINTFNELCHKFNCDYEIRDNYVYSLDNEKILFDELDAMQRIGCKADFCKNLPLPFEVKGAVRVKEQAQFNPLKFLANIVENLNIYEETKALEMIGNTVKTQFGKIKAESVVVATHFPFINKHGGYFLKMYQHRSYVLALEGANNLEGMYVDENDKGLSFRNYGKYLLLGGGGHRTGKKGGAVHQLRSLKEKYYPDSKEVFNWATQDCITLDSVAYIGKYGRNTKNFYVTTGFNKWGMTTSMVSAQLLSDLLTDTRNDFTDIYNPARSILKPQLFINAFETASNLLCPGAKRCAHLGCALKYNAAEHSFDCACHGSRFSKEGRLLNGPATDDLKN